MSLPPQVLKIKRKRIDEPVDSLFLGPRDAQHDHKRRTTEHSYVFRRQSITQEHPCVPRNLSSATPQIRTTLPGEENGYYDGPHQRLDMSPVEASASETPSGATDTTNEKKRIPSIPIRIFRLARSSDVTAAAQSELSDTRQPVFVEKSKSTTGTGAAKIGSSKVIKPTSDGEATTPRKRPSGLVPNFRNDRLEIKREEGTSDVALEEAMHQMAWEVEAEQQSQDLNQVNGSNHEDDIDMADASDEANYVYDTFVRDEAAGIVGSTSMDTMASSRDKGGVGYLIIEEEDQDIWERYVEKEDDSDPAWDSEQDDENAENYYGADYPEDEIDEDDEYGQRAYKYRHKGAADDEEYDLDDDSDVSSDDEEAKMKPWEKKSWRGLDDIVASDSGEGDDDEQRLASVR